MNNMAGTFVAGTPGLKELRAAQVQARRLLLLLLAALLLAVSLAGLAIGAMPVSLGDVLYAVIPLGTPDNAQAAEVVQAIRLPRLILAICAGATLGICGAALQGLFRNPLADPTIIGVSSGGAVAAAFIIVFGNVHAPQLMATAGPYALPAGAFLGSTAAILAVYALSQHSGITSGSSLILAGIAINAIASSALGYLSFLGTDDQLREMMFWTLGSLGRVTWASLLPVAALMIAAMLIILRLRSVLNVYLLGEREAVHLGVNVERLKREIILAVALGVGACVAVTGVIGFVGLAAPHIIRLFAGSDHRVVLPGSALLGALLLVGADLIARTAVAPAELPIGVLTGALGGPFFLWLLSRYRKELL